MATITVWVDANIATGNHDGTTEADAYATLALAEAGSQQNLTDGAGDILEIRCKATAGTADASKVEVDGSTTSSSCYIRIVATAAHYALKTGYSTSRYRLEQAEDDIFINKDDYTRVEGLQLKLTAATATAGALRITSSGVVANNATFLVKDCRVEGAISGTASVIGISVYDGNNAYGNAYIENCIVRGFSGGTSGRGISGGYAQHTYVYNCTVNNCAIGIYQANGDDYPVTATNCAVFNCTDDFGASAGSAVITYCASDDADGTDHQHFNENAGSEWTNTFTDYVNGDVGLKAGGTICIDTGTSLAGTFTTDIDGDTRSGTWDIGADEAPAAAGGSVVPAAMMYFNQMRARNRRHTDDSDLL